jgi:hypothetical protein
MNATLRKYFGIGALAIALFIIILIVVLVNQKPLDISGRYSLKVDGKYVNTTLVVTSHGDEFVFNMENSDGLKATYKSKKMLSGNYTLVDIAGENKTSEYKLIANPQGLEGTVDILPLGKVNIYFEKLDPGKNGQ